jgi:hypothetical protein
LGPARGRRALVGARAAESSREYHLCQNVDFGRRRLFLLAFLGFWRREHFLVVHTQLPTEDKR